jgi:uncharacterized membrane protein YqaE (UPF0057 family)
MGKAPTDLLYTPPMSNGTQDTNTLLMVIIAILLPPLAVFLKKGLGFHFILNIILLFITLWIGALIHALWCVLKG